MNLNAGLRAFVRGIAIFSSCVSIVAGSTQAADPTVWADFNLDGDVDQDDFSVFESCASGPSVPHNGSATCQRADYNNDNDVDESDFALFQGCYSGEDHLADLRCTALPLDMVFIPGGEFDMGDTFNEGQNSERPVHAVYIDGFCVDRYEVTNQQYAQGLNWAWAQGGLIAVISGVVYKAGGGTSYPYCDTTKVTSQSWITWDGGMFGVVSGRANDPMVRVSWYGSAAYANWRSAIQGRPPCYDVSTWDCNWGSGYRLPTEAEWEKAARGGVAGHRFPWSDTDTIQHSRANYYSDPRFAYDTSPTRGYHPGYNGTSPVGSFLPNGYGLYDAAGNVWEWCNDWYLLTYYSVSPYYNPTGPASGTYHILRGGSWYDYASDARCASRHGIGTPDFRAYDYGLRLVLNAG